MRPSLESLQPQVSLGLKKEETQSPNIAGGLPIYHPLADGNRRLLGHQCGPIDAPVLFKSTPGGRWTNARSSLVPGWSRLPPCAPPSSAARSLMQATDGNLWTTAIYNATGYLNNCGEVFAVNLSGVTDHQLAFKRD
jgi:hypothetical protein